MKRILSLIIMATAMLFAHAQQIPAEASHFLNTFFPDYQVQGVAEYAATSPIAYTVELDNNVHIDFDANGAWVGIQAPEAGIPEAAIPGKIAQYLKERGYDDLSTFATIEKKSGAITITNQNGAGYIFDSNGRYLRDTTH